MTTVQIFPDLEQLSRAAADLFVGAARAAVAGHGRFLMALSGGGTPQPLYRLLAQSPYREQMPWHASLVFWGDERLVPPDHEQSSYGMAARLLLDQVPLPPEQIFRAWGETDAATAVADYQRKLQSIAAPWPRFHLILLGMGQDGHTASLFPGPISAAEREEPVIAVSADYDGRPAQRLTLTPPVINDAHHILFLVAGAAKAEALFQVLAGPPDPETWPAQRIAPRHGRVTWLVDAAAARLLPPVSTTKDASS